MNVSVVIAALDEAQTVADVVRAARRCRRVHEIIVVSDGSRDRTGAVARQAGADVIELPRNVGKAGAVMAGVERAAGDIVVLLDADLIGLRSEHVDELLHPVLDDGIDMVIGVFNRDLVQNVLPSFSGQRAIPRFHLLRHPELRDKGFGLERTLAAIARRERWRVRRIELPGVSHRLKEEKYGLVRGYRAKLKAAEDLVRNVRPRRSRRTGGTVLIGLVTMYGLMELFVAQTAAKDLALMPAPAGSDRILLIAAHNDDELLAAGGYLAAAREAGSAVAVVILTNGDANRFSAALLGRRLRPAANAFIREGQVRQRESIAALGRLGFTSNQIFFLGFPDRGLKALRASHWSRATPYTSPFTRADAPPYQGIFRASARYTGEDLVDALTDIITAFRPTVLLTHSVLDSHADHQATSEFVSLALDRTAQADAVPLRRFGYVIHADDFPRPLRYAPQAFLSPPPGLRDEARWLSFPLTPAAALLKGEAMRLYRTQFHSPYLRMLLSGFLRRNELFIEESPPSRQ